MYYPLLDLFRYIAASAVAIGHFALVANGNADIEFLTIIAVEFFFVLSGFVLAPQIDKVARSQSRKFLTVFLLRRWLRTIPSYLVALICAAIVFGYGDFGNFLRFATYCQNFFSDNSEHNFFSVGWSLSIEEWFYILFPPIMMLYYNIKNSLADALKLCLMILIIFILLRLSFGDSESWGRDVRRSVVFRLDSIVYGYIAYKIRERIPVYANVTVIILGILTLISLQLNGGILQKSDIGQNIFFPLCGVLFSSFVITISKIDDSSHQVNFLCRWAGHLSYPIYLFHIVIIGLMGNVGPTAGYYMLYILCINVFASIFYTYFERPILTHRPRYPRDSVPPCR